MSRPARAYRPTLATQLLLVCLLALAAVPLPADTGGARRPISPAGCPCRCNQGKTHAGCSRMCDAPRRASRWGANSCAKPRIKPPAETPGAGPRLPRPARAERASL